MRDNTWAENRMDQIWRDHFSDVPQENKVKIKFGRRARTRLGSIKQLHNYRSNKVRTIMLQTSRQSSKNINDSLITLTGYFKDENIPQYIIDLTIAHELCHYAHGFSSPLPQLFKYPHQGGLVDKELAKRGFGAALKDQKKWLKTEWPKIIGVKIRRRRKRRPKVVKISNIFQILFN
jgi:hypothetical protein